MTLITDNGPSKVWEKNGRVVRLFIRMGQKHAEIEWEDHTKIIYPRIDIQPKCNNITDPEWDILKMAFTTGKNVTIKNSFPYTFEQMLDFSTCILEVK
jgi:hypothetical protein